MAQVIHEWDSTGKPSGADALTNTTKTAGFYIDFINPYFREFFGAICNVQMGDLISPGSGYAEGVYQNVDFIRLGAANYWQGGRDLQATVTVDATGAVTSVVKTRDGSGYRTGDVLVIADITQVGGVGGGLRVACDSADASIGVIYDCLQANSASSTMGFLLGCERDDNGYNYGFSMLNTNPRSSSYPYFRSYNIYYLTGPSTSNNYYGGYTIGGSNYDWNHWHYNDPPGEREKIIYSADPGNQYITWHSEETGYVMGYFKLNRNPDLDYPPTSSLPTWVRFYGQLSGVIYYSPSSIDYGSNLVNVSSRSLSYPVDMRGYFFTEQTCRSNVFILGSTPPDLYFGDPSENAMLYGGTYSDGVDLRLTKTSQGLYVRLR